MKSISWCMVSSGGGHGDFRREMKIISLHPSISILLCNESPQTCASSLAGTHQRRRKGKGGLKKAGSDLLCTTISRSHLLPLQKVNRKRWIWCCPIPTLSPPSLILSPLTTCCHCYLFCSSEHGGIQQSCGAAAFFPQHMKKATKECFFSSHFMITELRLL